MEQLIETRMWGIDRALEIECSLSLFTGTEAWK